MKITNQEAAQLGLLVMYAWDMCHGQETLTPAADGRIEQQAGWKVVGYITGADNVIATTLKGKTWLSAIPLPDYRVCYGYVAEKDGQYVAVIRGTDSRREWEDDAIALMKKEPLGAGRVTGGFYTIYESMTYVPVDSSSESQPLADGIASLVARNSVTVVGHSLGAALGTYLAFDLAQLSARVSACLFASPKTGDDTFVAAVDEKLKNNYVVVNYVNDAVPKLPQRIPGFEFAPLSREYRLNDDHALYEITEDLPCNHHMICYVARLSRATYTGTWQTWKSDDEHCAECVAKANKPATAIEPVEPFFLFDD